MSDSDSDVDFLALGDGAAAPLVGDHEDAAEHLFGPGSDCRSDSDVDFLGAFGDRANGVAASVSAAEAAVVADAAEEALALALEVKPTFRLGRVRDRTPAEHHAVCAKMREAKAAKTRRTQRSQCKDSLLSAKRMLEKKSNARESVRLTNHRWGVGIRG